MRKIIVPPAKKRNNKLPIRNRNSSSSYFSETELRKQTFEYWMNTELHYIFVSSFNITSLIDCRTFVLVNEWGQNTVVGDFLNSHPVICLPLVNCHLSTSWKFLPKTQFLPWLTLLSSNDRESVALDGFILGVCTRPVVEMFCGAVADTFSGAVGECERKCVWLTVKVDWTIVWLTVGL